MKRSTYILMILLGIVACEEIYRPDIDDVDDLLVVEAILRTDKTDNAIRLFRSKGFYDNRDNYTAVTGANVSIVTDAGETIQCSPSVAGTYTFSGNLSSDYQYQLKISLGRDEYISDFQQVPDKPVLDSVYGERGYNIYIDGTANNSEDIVNEYGVQLYSDIIQQGNINNYRFYGRKIIQYTSSFDTVMMERPATLPIYIWNSVYPTGAFNIAGPPEYSTSRSIMKHPLEFFKNDYRDYMPDTLSFHGWIYIIDQFGINENSFNFYKDINQQIDAEGRIFDPVYIQLQGNIRCETDPEKVVLGNFEITSHTESRYFLTYSRFDDRFQLKKIGYNYVIPNSGYVKVNMPAFWESINKKYPNE